LETEEKEILAGVQVGGERKKQKGKKVSHEFRENAKRVTWKGVKEVSQIFWVSRVVRSLSRLREKKERVRMTPEKKREKNKTGKGVNTNLPVAVRIDKSTQEETGPTRGGRRHLEKKATEILEAEDGPENH